MEVCEGVEPQDLRAQRRHLVERLAEEVPDLVGLRVEVHLTEIRPLAVDDVDLLVKGVPVEAIRAVGEANLEDGQVRFAHEQPVEMLGRGDHVAVGVEVAFALPELVPVDEEVGELGLVTVRQHVLELRRSDREMVEHQVQLQQDAELVEGFEIAGRYEVSVQVIVDDGEAAIKVAVEDGGQHVQQAEDVGELGAPEHAHHASEIAVDAVGVCVEHDPVRQVALHVTGMTS